MPKQIFVTLPFCELHYGVMYTDGIRIVEPVEIEMVMFYKPQAPQVHKRMRYISPTNPKFDKAVRCRMFGVTVRCTLPEVLPCRVCSGTAKDCIHCGSLRGSIVLSEVRANDNDPNWIAIRDALRKPAVANTDIEKAA